MKRTSRRSLTAILAAILLLKLFGCGKTALKNRKQTSNSGFATTRTIQTFRIAKNATELWADEIVTTMENADLRLWKPAPDGIPAIPTAYYLKKEKSTLILWIIV